MSLIGWLIFLSSLIGYQRILRRSGVSPYLTWITIFWIQTLVLYLGAMVNLLPAFMIGVSGLGIALLLVDIILIVMKRWVPLGIELHLFDVWMASMGLLLGIAVYHSLMVHYDNFSHWATMVKFLYTNGQLPTAGGADQIISFTSYPPAMALFINYFVHLVGFSEGSMLLGQFIYIWAALYSIFAFLKDKTRSLLAAILVLTIAVTMIFNVEIRFNNLLVDYVLAVVALAGLTGVYVYQKRPTLQMIHVMLAASNLLLIKNSGAFFVALIFVYYAYTLVVNRTRRAPMRQKVMAGFQNFLRWLMGLGISYLPFYLWSRHVKQSFTTSKHEINAAAYGQQLQQESGQYFSEIAHKMLQANAHLSSLSTRGFILFNVVLLVTWIVLKMLGHRNRLLKMALLFDGIFMIYYFSMYVMYIVSMPYAEAIQLAGFERYMSTIVILLLLLSAATLVITLDESFYEQDFEKRNLRSFSSLTAKKAYQMGAMFCFFFSVIGINSEIGGMHFNDKFNQNALPLKLKALSHDEMQLNQCYILVVDAKQEEVDSYYAAFVGKYYFFSPNVEAREAFDMSPQELKELNDSYDYVVIPNEHETYSKLMDKAYHQKVKTGLFKTEKNGLKPVNQLTF
ncbi:ABC transporter permease [Weissella minor]|uniref:ABC transporter permease n=1 Tax=Weissella minor TaxID=1620 RepID=UPI001BAF2DCE|nr:ABC transporter permease [Weissella minor]MBS0950118.1 ABC transporter permease [Weissella minor]